MGGGGGKYSYISYTVTSMMISALRWAKDDSHFNVLLTVRDKVTGHYHNFLRERKAEVGS